jgi:hypothetical protein
MSNATREARRKAYFQKQKEFYKTFTGSVMLGDANLFVRMGSGKVVDAEVVDGQMPSTPDIYAKGGTVAFKRNHWAYNPTLVAEFIAKAAKIADRMSK